MKKIMEKIRFLAMTAADDIILIASLYSRKNRKQEYLGSEV